jgi:protein-tyrosine phosphatase
MIRFDGLPPEVMQAMCTPMHLIMPASPPNPSRPGTGALYLGSLSATMEQSVLREHNITHLVQVLDVPWLPLTERDGFECYRIDILDVPSADLRGHLEGACKDIDKALRGGKNILVHCQQVSCDVRFAIYRDFNRFLFTRAYLAVQPL